MAEFRFGTDSQFKNWFLKGEAKGRAEIAGFEAQYERNITLVEQAKLDREVSRFVAINMAKVAILAAEEGVSIDTFNAIMLDRSRAEDANFSTYCSEYLKWWFGNHEVHRKLADDEERVRLKVAETRGLNEAATDKNLADGEAEVKVAADRAQKTIETIEEYNDSPLSQEAKNLKRAGELRQEIEDTLAMPNKSIEWRQAQAALLTVSLTKLEKKIAEEL